MLLFDILVTTGIIGNSNFPGPLERLGDWHGRFHFFLLVWLKIALHQFEAHVGVIVAIKINKGIGWVVIRLPEIPEIFIGQVGNVGRVAARIDAVDVFGKERLDHARLQYTVRR